MLTKRAGPSIQHYRYVGICQLPFGSCKSCLPILCDGFEGDDKSVALGLGCQQLLRQTNGNHTSRAAHACKT